MPLIALAIAFVLLIGLVILSIPLSIVQRYRMGTVRRPARGWIASINIFAFFTSAAFLLTAAVLSTPWVPKAIPYTFAGLAAGFLLGLIGLAATQWSESPGSLHYKPSRLLVLSITLVVLARLGYGVWRGWRAWQESTDASWLAEAGAAGSMAAGAVVIGYYLVFWFGVRRKLKRASVTAAPPRRRA